MTRISDPFDELRSKLEQAHSADHHHAAIGRQSRRTDRGRVRSVGLLATAAVLVTGTAVAATTPWNPTLGGDNGVDPPTRTTGDVPAEQARALEVLRRPQTDADRSPAVLDALRTVSPRIGSGLNVDGIRLLRKHSQDNVLLLPFEQAGPEEDPRNQIPDGLCVYTAYTGAAGSGPSDAGGAPAPTPISAASCGTLADIQHGRVTGLVPDGVSRVRATLSDGKSVTVDVADNYYELASKNGERPAADPSDLVWLDADGRVVPKTVQ